MPAANKVNVLAKDAAKICGVSDNYVRKVLRNERTNELIMLVVMELKERTAQTLTDVQQIAEKFKQTGRYDFE